jgi:cytochrome c-type biogenesis protein CcmF
MIVEVSHFLTILATGLFLLSGLFATFINNTEYISNLIARTYSHAFFFLIASFGLYVWLAATDNFSVLYIASHSNTNLPIFYKISSIWSAHEGSMFLWIVFLAVWGFIFNFRISQSNPLKSLTLGILSLVIVGFLLFLLLTSNPFQTILPIPPIDGADINPVLQDPALVIHPPTLYLGYVGFSIPFACAIAFLIKGNSDIEWELMVQKWSIMAWIFLTIGITLGSWWAYYELGWGGYWFWDPVENVALMPWLAATAFIHSLSVSIKSKKLRVWTILLSILVFSLSLFGAFIVRSGIIDSVHSFANDPERGLYLLGFISLIIINSLILFVLRFSKIQSIESIKRFSKESFVSINNIFFGVLIFSVMLGVTYPLIYEYLLNQKISVGAPFYTAIFSPIVLLACIFLIFSVDSKWSRRLKSNLLNLPVVISTASSVIITLLFLYLFDINDLYMNALIFVGFLIILRYMFEIYKLIKFRKYINPFSAIAHIALGLLLISISLNSSLSTERAMSLKIDETEKYKDLTINFQNINLSNGSNYDAIKADLLIQTTNGKSFKLSPEKRRYFTRGQITTETAIHASPIRDIYITIGDQLDDGSWVVNIQLNYLIRWIWFSAILMSFAGILLIITNKKSTFTFKKSIS